MEMDDYSALAQRISVSVSGVSGALILSRDGLVLGAYPNEDESLAKPAWLRFITLGEPDKSFVEFPTEVWAYVKRGPYAAFAAAAPGTRPGILLDQMEQLLLVAEEARSRRDTLRVPEPTTAPSGKPRTSLHPQADAPAPAEVSASSSAAEAAPEIAAPDRRGFRRNPGTSAATGPSEPAPVEPAADAPAAADGSPPPPMSALKKEPQKLAGAGEDAGFDDEAEVDRVLLAKEFSGLLQVDSDGDEGNP
jgi:hypothetical protein